MSLENDLGFLCDILKKCHIQTQLCAVTDPVSSVFGSRLSFLLQNKSEDISVKKFFGKLSPRTLYRFKSELGLAYSCLLLPAPRSDVLFIGPYLTAPMPKDEIAEFARTQGISQKNLRYINEYYASIPVLLPGSHLFSVIGTFCERIFKTPSFSVVDIKGESTHTQLRHGEAADFDDMLVEMKTIERRYSFENELMEAVSLGQIHKEAELFAAFSEPHFEKRVADPVRNAKNYGIIMNTLLRKAAQKGGVHPMYLDSISSSFAKKIEQIASTEDSFELMSDMFRSYCRLVRKHKMKNYSPAVQKTMLLIDSDLTADLSLTVLAERQSISAGYLSAIFKKETGKTISEYIREKRMEYAQHLLATTHQQIQSVALACGIVDVQYFSKLFKRQTGKTPKEYRESLKK